jgi:DNA-binding winged helix-turn-helix (wHTH) protein/tetratricopeptide (TPR) repeat protein
MGARTRHTYEFGPFSLDLEDRCLERDGEVLPLTAKAFDLLLTLVERRGRVVTKDELFDTVWAGSFVEESNLTVSVSALRRVLGDRPSASQYIETVPKRGYRFVAPVREVAETCDEQTTVEGVMTHERTRAEVVIEEVTALAPRTATQPLARRAVVAGAAAVFLGLGAFTVGFGVRTRPGAGTENPEARAAYLKGRHYWNKRTADGLSKSVASYRRAIEVDPNYALGYAGLADSYVFDLSDWPKAEAAAHKAMDLDPSLAAPHATIGFGLMFHQWDWVGAERELRRAVELDPEYATARQWLATWLLAHGRLEEAKRELDDARRIDPLSVSIITDQAALAYFQHDYERAIALASEAIELDCDAIYARGFVANCYERLGRGEEFIGARRSYREATKNAEGLAEDEAAYRSGGIKAVCLADARMNEAEWRNPDQFAYAIAQGYACAGEYDVALGWLERACQIRCFAMLYVKVDPVFDEIRRHPRFAAVEGCVGLSSY